MQSRGDAQRGHTRLHYDSVALASQQQGREHALRERGSGASIDLKRFHNQIERLLIARFGGPRLLDLGCGRGGDVDKWVDAGVQHVLGLDLSEQGVLEARQRFAAAAARKHCADLDYQFLVTEDVGRRPLAAVEPGTYNIVTCMFALQYFFRTRAAVQQVMRSVADALRPGGYFVGVVPDGARVLQLLQCGQQEAARQPACSRRSFANAYVRLDMDGLQCLCGFGAAYTCKIGDTVAGSLEYLVTADALAQQARAVGLVPVTDYGNPGLDALLCQPK